MVAFTTSMLIGVVGVLAVVWYGSTRRKPGESLTWGQAYVAAAYTFFMMFWWYGVIPHQWLTWADNELNWRPDRFVHGPKVFGRNLFEPLADGGAFMPFTLNWLHIRDFLVLGIYGIGVVFHVWIWAWWNDRKKKAEAKASTPATSTYGRPLVKKG